MNTHFLSCERSTMLLHQNSSPLLRRFRFRYVKFKPHLSRFRCLLPQIAVQSSANVIAAAAKAASVHGAVYSAINHVAVTAVAIASGACLSTKVDFLWPKPDEQPGTIMQDGVDVTGYPIFTDAKAGTEGYSFCKEGTPWPNPENRRSLFSSLYSYRENFGCVGSVKW